MLKEIIVSNNLKHFVIERPLGEQDIVAVTVKVYTWSTYATIEVKVTFSDEVKDVLTRLGVNDGKAVTSYKCVHKEVSLRGVKKEKQQQKLDAAKAELEANSETIKKEKVAEIIADYNRIIADRVSDINAATKDRVVQWLGNIDNHTFEGEDKAKADDFTAREAALRKQLDDLHNERTLFEEEYKRKMLEEHNYNIEGYDVKPVAEDIIHYRKSRLRF